MREKVAMVAFVLMFGMPEAMEVWVGSRKMPSPALGRGEVTLKSKQCRVLETLKPVLYKQTATIICEYETTNKGDL